MRSQQSNWEVQKAKLKVMFPRLKEDDLNFEETNKREMISKLEFKLAMTAQELQDILEAS